MSRREWKRFATRCVKAALGVVVVWAVGRHVVRTWRELSAHGESVRVEPAWVAAAVLLYLVGLTASGVVFGKVLAEGSAPVPLAPAVRAYLISHLGKYVPGKALVVVLRVGMVVPHGARPATAAFATFYETFAMMASGSLIAAAGFAAGPRPILGLPLALSLGLALAFLAVIEPRVFPRLARLVTLPFPNVGSDAMPRLSQRLLATALAWSALGWVLLGLSQVAVIRALGYGGPAIHLWPLILASVALATVAGFVVAVLPGGLGVREWVLMTALGPGLGADRAVIAALGLRLTWVLAEVCAAGGLALVPLTPARGALPVPGRPPA